MINQPIVEFNDFSFKYYSQKNPTLKNINLTINQGEKILIIGPSGSGKSTLGNCLNGLIPFTYKGEIEGSLKVKNIETSKSNIFSLSKVIGTVLQDSDSQFIGLSVAEDIAFAMENDCVTNDEMKERVNEVAEMIGLDHLLNLAPHELSGGQKQRTALAGIMVDDVDILLFDEPLANLDPKTGKKAIEIIDDIHKKTKKTIVIIEHRIEDVLHRDVDRIILMGAGEIIADLNPHQILSSNLLLKHGIREPLYVTLLKYAGVHITEEMKPGYLTTLDFDLVKEEVISWYESTEKVHSDIADNVILDIKNVSFKYEGNPKQVLDDITFTIKKNEMISIVGRNGAGKSTLSKLICGFETGFEGEILFNNDSIKNKSISDISKSIGYVMQNPNHMVTESMIYDEVALGLRLRNMDESQIEIKVDKVLEVCGLTRFKNWPISALSYGQKKRVTIASILILDPEIIILDEPTAGQDYYHYTEIMEFLKMLNQTHGITIIMITHDMHLMLEYTERSIVVSEGVLITDSTSSDVLTDIEVINKASLKETSLFHVAEKIGLKEPKSLVDRFIAHENEVRNHG